MGSRGDGDSKSSPSPGAFGRHGERWAPLLLVAGTAMFYLARLGLAGLYDPNEGMYAEIPREMVLLGDWLTPRFNFIRYFEKPPLLYWLTALAYQLFGITEFSARLATALAATLGVGVVYGIGRDLWGRRAALVSGLILATSFGYFIFSRIILTDMLFTA
ncbi:MAG: glycosyltransferase family 39 protein, partial [candidate division NC10 bacterium]